MRKPAAPFSTVYAGLPGYRLAAKANIVNEVGPDSAMAAETSVYVANRIGGAGNVVMFTFDAFPPVQVRGAIADAVFANYPDIKVVDRITPDVADGGIGPKTLPDAGVENNRTAIGKIAFDADLGASARSEKGVFT